MISLIVSNGHPCTESIVTANPVDQWSADHAKYSVRSSKRIVKILECVIWILNFFAHFHLQYFIKRIKHNAHVSYDHNQPQSLKT